MKQNETEERVAISVRLPKDLAARFAEYAVMQHRSMDAQLRVLIEEALDKERRS